MSGGADNIQVALDDLGGIFPRKADLGRLYQHAVDRRCKQTTSV